MRSEQGVSTGLWVWLGDGSGQKWLQLPTERGVRAPVIAPCAMGSTPHSAFLLPLFHSRDKAHRGQGVSQGHPVVGAESGRVFRRFPLHLGRRTPRQSQLGLILGDPGLPFSATDGKTEKRGA